MNDCCEICSGTGIDPVDGSICKACWGFGDNSHETGCLAATAAIALLIAVGGLLYLLGGVSL